MPFDTRRTLFVSMAHHYRAAMTIRLVAKLSVIPSVTVKVHLCGWLGQDFRNFPQSKDGETAKSSYRVLPQSTHVPRTMSTMYQVVLTLVTDEAALYRFSLRSS